ncbi:MAG: cyclic nucleotide-binding domain-containing protein [Bdellovibrionales bacterium]|nr:cyclic nucleotide-binding domain-containing protein [Bdellovibrionales bacterium]
MAGADSKKVFLIATESEPQRRAFERLVLAHYPGSTLYFAEDGAEAWAKASNVPPHVFIIDSEISKVTGLTMVNQVTHDRKLAQTALIVVGMLPTEATHVDEFVTGRLQFYNAGDGEADFKVCLAKALNFAFHGKSTEYSVRFLTEGERLLTEGEKAESVYIVKEGRLRAFRVVDGKETFLGYVERGEFVGEMAYINGEPRTANVDAVSSCELIEVPVGTLERVLYRRPSWSKTLMQTLARRLKQANAAKADA